MSHRRAVDDSEEETSYSAEAVTAYATAEVLKERAIFKELAEIRIKNCVDSREIVAVLYRRSLLSN